MSVIGQPDFQRGVTSAQILLATGQAATGNVTVGIPPNAETLVVIFKPTTASSNVSAAGATSGVPYPTYKAIQAQGSSGYDTWFIDVSSALDIQALITIFPASSATWFVYADAGVHVTLDASKRVSIQGLQYAVPAIPGPYASDHPPNELSHAMLGAAASGFLVASPGPGLRLRAFTLGIAIPTAGLEVGIELGVGGARLIHMVGAGGLAFTLPGQGFALPVNVGLYMNLFAAGAATTWAYYTTETP